MAIDINEPPPREPASKARDKPLRVALFVTCLVNFNRPNIGFAATKLLKQAGFAVEVPLAQTCCGQPNYNSGDRKGAIKIARQQILTLENYDYVVAPSGSCAAMIARHFPKLFANGDMAKRAQDLANKTFELSHFLTSVARMSTTQAQYQGRVAIHDSCSGLRELGIKQAPRKLLQAVDGLELVELQTPEACCGFGGTFCVKYPDISNEMLGRKIADIKQTNADTIVAGDLGCLMNIAGKIARENQPIKVFHLAEVLANMANDPINQSQTS